MIKTKKHLKSYAIALCLLFSCSVMNAQKVEAKAEVEKTEMSSPVIVADDGDEELEIAFDLKELREDRVAIEDTREDKPFVMVEQMPEFVGGQMEMLKFIQKHLTYPEDAQENGVQGRVIVRFVVNKKGKVVDAIIIRGLDSSCDTEALRVINMMPDWIPGKQNGQNVSTYFTIPIVFRFTVDEADESEKEKNN